MIATQESISASPRNLAARLEALAPLAMIVVGLLVRLRGAHSRFLNADEAMHYLLSLQPSVVAAYHASLGTAHPPLLILLLHYWGMISSTEFFLRLPSVIAGTASGWFLYAWLRRVTDHSTALIALALFLFSPALIYTSAELRQYALLLCFMAATLYLLDRACMENSPGMMLTSAAPLYLALLTHYCALIFAGAVGIYGIMRLASIRPLTGPHPPLVRTWVATQTGAAAIAAFLWKTHILVIRNAPLTQDVAQSYLRNSLFQRGQENVGLFILKANIRLFHFLFSQGAVSVAGMLLFVVGIVLLWRNRAQPTGRQPSPRQLAILLLLPFVINCAAALAGTYPYGGTRHNSYLAFFAMPAVAAAVTRWKVRHEWIKLAAIAFALGICNLTVSPAGAYIGPRNQQKKLMDEAVAFVHKSAHPNAILLTDFESGLLLSYYVCHHSVVPSEKPAELFYSSRCGDYESMSLLPRLWVFRAATFPDQMRELRQMLAREPDREIWLFQAGFIVDREPEFQSLLAHHDCPSPRKFGENILICRIRLPPAS